MLLFFVLDFEIGCEGKHKKNLPISGKWEGNEK